MGLGKTFTGAEKMCQLDAKINLVICQKSKIQDWLDHFNTYYDWTVCDLTNKKEFELFLFFIKVPDNLDHPVVAVINYDLIFRRKELLQLKHFTLMLDESSVIQHDTTKRSSFILKLNPDNVILLSGTPTGGKYENLLSQLNLLGWNISEDLFWNQYVDWEWADTDDGYWRKKINGYKNVERLKRKMREKGCHFLKTEEVFDLPDQIHQSIKINITSEYKKFRKDLIVTVDGIELVGDTSFAERLYKRQLCGQYNGNKLSAFEDLLESTEDRLIVFYNFNAELDLLKHICEAHNREMSIINGQVKDLHAYEEINDSVTLIQYQAGAMGLNLQKANKIIYFTPPESSELFEQSKKRIHRIGQSQSCFYYYLTCKNSIEEEIYATLAMRKDYTDALYRKENKL